MRQSHAVVNMTTTRKLAVSIDEIHALTEYRRKVPAWAVVFRPVSEFWWRTPASITHSSLDVSRLSAFSPETLSARGRPIIVEWERDARHSAGLSLVRYQHAVELWRTGAKDLRVDSRVARHVSSSRSRTRARAAVSAGTSARAGRATRRDVTGRRRDMLRQHPPPAQRRRSREFQELLWRRRTR
ncbi:hypothetical protein EVAR_75088_1 [Eumeta japonica]|uniref:Uncharacterized protein n=1 Tax=Eumeta variegata TaxID=151549 RepID=A0A4C1W0N0_EUMVA|nr:hypothetical protein EVAR_75088_1 [Eumeta japonica]